MGKSALRRLSIVLCYALYGMGILVVALWLLFPTEAVRRSFEEMLGRAWPELSWKVGGVGLELPANLTFRHIDGYAKQGDAVPLVRFERLFFQLHPLASMLSWSGQAGYRLVIDKGSVAGTARWQGAHGGGRIEGTIQDVSLAAVPWIGRQLGRTVQGLASGTFTADVQPALPLVVTLEARLSVANGRLGLQRPILGCREIPFTRAEVTVLGQGATFVLTQGTLTSHLFDSRFSGTVALHRDPGLGQIDVQGVADLKDYFFKGLDNTVNLQAFRLQFKNNALPFSIMGDLTSPGIYYGEHAALVQNLEQELR
ncbi:MAG: type II secretion system protein GspN [Desulfobulbus sp.]|nr:type II secretion system protein GspN [Desulfobulbus sp.]